MTDNAETAPGHASSQRPWTGRRFLRRVVYPLAVIAVIIGTIWWLEARDEGATSPTGERYGPKDLPAALAPAGADVGAELGSLAPDFLLEVLDGGDARLSDYRGQPVVLNFWATWCRPCRKEMPQFVEAYDRHKDEGLVVIAVNLQEGKSVIQPFAEDFGMDFPVMIDRDGEVGDRYRLIGLPQTYFIDRDGVIRSVFTGPLEDTVEDTNVQGAIGGTELERRIAEIMGDDDGSG